MAKHPQSSPQNRSLVLKRSVVINGHKTSISLEDAFWSALKEIAANQKVTLPVLVTRIEDEREHANLSSAIRLFVLEYYRLLAALKREKT